MHLVGEWLTTPPLPLPRTDPLKMPFELLRQPLHFLPDQSAAPQWLRDANTAIQEADGFVVVTPEYNCGLPPALVNMLDHFPPASYRHRPAAIACYSLGEGTHGPPPSPATRSVREHTTRHHRVLLAR